MMPVQSTLEDGKKMEEFHPPLIGGLPDDIALLCLVRIPRRYHHLLRCVSKRWRALLSSEEWHSYRRSHNLEETWIYAICKNSSRRNCCYVLDLDPQCQATQHWKRLQGILPQCQKREGMAFETLGRKLYLLGGCSWHEDATDEVYFYDASANVWGEAAPMPTARCYFVSAILDNRLYATGGLGMSSISLQSWDTYDSHSNCWTSNQDPKVATNIQKSITVDGKIYTIHDTNHNLHYAGVFDPSHNSWQHVNNEIVLCWRGPTAVVDGTLYMLDQTSGTKLMKWQKETGDWVALGRLSPWLVKPPCQLAASGRSIIVIGRGLSMVVIDVDKASKVGGMLVSSFPLPELDRNLSVISCKTITI